MAEKTQPQVGMGATLVYPNDRYPYVVVAVSPSGKQITVEELETVTPAMANTEPSPGEWSYYYTAEDLRNRRTGQKKVAHLRKNGRYYLNDIPLALGTARLRWDYSY